MAAQEVEDRLKSQHKSRASIVALQMLEKAERMGDIILTKPGHGPHSQRRGKGGAPDEDTADNPDVLFVKAKQIGNRRVLIKLQAKVEEQVAFAHGKLVLRVEHAKELASEGTDKSDPYCVVFWNNVRLGHSPVVHDELHPVWGWQLVLPLPHDVDGCSLRVEVMDKDYTGTDEFLGQVTVEGGSLVCACLF